MKLWFMLVYKFSVFMKAKFHKVSSTEGESVAAWQVENKLNTWYRQSRGKIGQGVIRLAAVVC